MSFRHEILLLAGLGEQRQCQRGRRRIPLKSTIDPLGQPRLSPLARVERRRTDVEKETGHLGREDDPVGDDQQMTKATLLHIFTIEDERCDEERQREELRVQRQTRPDDQLFVLAQNFDDRSETTAKIRPVSQHFQFLLHDDETDGERGEEVDQQRKDRVNDRHGQMHFRPDRSMRDGIVEDARRFAFLIAIVEKFEENELINIRQQNRGDRQENQAASVTTLAEPSTVENQSDVNTFDGDQRGKPVNHSAGRNEKKIERTTEDLMN